MAATIYATEAQIEANMKGVDFSEANAAVSTADLTTMLAEESQVIDQHVQPNYTLPITDADALIFLRKICIDLVIYRVAKVLMPRESKELPNGKIIQDISHSSAYREAMKMLVRLAERKIALPNLAVKSRVFVSSTLESSTEIVQTFDKDVEQW